MIEVEGIEIGSRLLSPLWAALLMLFILAWSIFWKGIALWRAARKSHNKWFIALVILQTLSVLEIIYLAFFCDKRKKIDPLIKHFSSRNTEILSETKQKFCRNIQRIFQKIFAKS